MDRKGASMQRRKGVVSKCGLWKNGGVGGGGKGSQVGGKNIRHSRGGGIVGSINNHSD